MAAKYTISISPNENAIENALSEARLHKNEAVEVVFAPGVYAMTAPAVITSADSRSADAPLTFRAEKNGSVVLTAVCL